MAIYDNPYELLRRQMEAQTPVVIGEEDMVGKPKVTPYIPIDPNDVAGKPEVIPSSGVAKTPSQIQQFEEQAMAPARRDKAINKAVDEGYADYIKALAYYTTPTVTPEMQQRRERAAYARAGIGALGNVLSSFSNLFFTGQGAPSQTMPAVPDAHAAIKDSRAMQNEQMRQYIDAQGRRLNAAMSMQSARDARKATAQKLQNDMVELQLKMQKAEQDGKLAEAKILGEKYKAEKSQYDALLSQYKAENAPEEFELKKKQTESAVNANNARAKASAASAETSRANARAANARATKTMQDGSLEVDLGDGTFARIPKSRANTANLGKIVRSLGGDGTVTVESTDPLTGETKTQKKAMDANQMWSWIGQQVATRGLTEDAAAQLRNLSGDEPMAVDPSPIVKGQNPSKGKSSEGKKKVNW